MAVYYIGSVPYSDELYHHGIKGMHWGVRHDYDPKGPSTMNRIGMASAKVKRIGNAVQATGISKGIGVIKDIFGGNASGTKNGSAASQSQAKETIKKRRIKSAVKIGAAVAGAGLLAYGAYKVGKSDDRIAITNPKTNVEKNIWSAPVIEVVESLGDGKNLPKAFKKYMKNK